MKEYGMITKDGEIIYRVKCETLAEAISHFTFLKKMDTGSLLEIYDVRQIGK